VPVVLVTHDWGEAALMGDEIAVIDRGRIVQRGSASALATTPASAFVADFTGAVVLTGTAAPAGAGDGLTTVELDGGGTALTTDRGEGRVGLSVYPWEITIAPAPGPRDESAQNQLNVRITSITTVGNRVRIGLAGGQSLVAEVTGRAVDELELAVGREVTASWKATATRLVEL
jgi:molybdopterin-binding protein